MNRVVAVRDYFRGFEINRKDPVSAFEPRTAVKPQPFNHAHLLPAALQKRSRKPMPSTETNAVTADQAAVRPLRN